MAEGDSADKDVQDKNWTESGETDGWLSQVLPGVLAVAFIIIVAVAVMAGEGALMGAARQTNSATLQTVLSNTIQRFEDWSQLQRRHAYTWANSPDLRADYPVLAELTPENARSSPEMERLRSGLGRWMAQYGYRSFDVISPEGIVLASSDLERIGERSPALSLVDPIQLNVSSGVLTRPVMEETGAGGDNTATQDVLTLYAIAPIRGDARENAPTLGYLAFAIDPLLDYSSTFEVGRTGLSGDTYVIDRNGRLLSNIRYDEEMVAADLLLAGHPSMLHLDARDPGLDITVLSRPDTPYEEWPLTVAASSVIADGRGENLRGYRDQRGVLVMGAWVWDARHDFGVITEIQVSEALAGANQARAVLRVFAVAMALSFILLAVLFSAHRNISRQKAQATAEANQRVRQILMTAAEGIYGIDGHGVVTFINPRACTMLGYEEHELVGKVMHSVVHHSYRDGSIYSKEDCPVHTAGVPIEANDQEVFWTKSGQPIPIEFSTTPIDPENLELGAVITFRDITKRRRDELSLRRYAQELKRSNAELQEFAYAASHDLQEPLRKIQAFGERLNNKYSASLDETGQHYLARMVDAAGRMRRLIDDLLSYSRVNSKTTSYLPVELSAVLADVVSDLEPRIASEEATVRIGELPAIEADPGQMHQLFLNLVANALKFRRPGVSPVVSVEGGVEVGENGAVARIQITDNGIGFEPRHAERIFGMFERLHGREEYDGTGVGLATCRKIAERHSGELTAWGEPDAGAVFTLILPVRQGAII
ncbi:MAG: PAS domain S-box protein [Alphaproteobacteria bacterium]|nr:PAS domain S-box protein [Alphaproteobacteria bacterium]